MFLLQKYNLSQIVNRLRADHFHEPLVNVENGIKQRRERDGRKKGNKETV
jgi:hypothetical protein